MRLIVGGPYNATSCLSEFIGDILKPLLGKINSHLKDDYDLKTRISKEFIEKNHGTFVSMDVIAMYENFTLKRALTAVRFWWNKYPELIDSRFTWEFIKEAISLIIHHNEFAFKDKFYRQMGKGFPTGSQSIPILASIIMGQIEDETYKKLIELKRKKLADYFRNNFARFLDDGFIYWLTSLGEPSILLNCLNSIDKNIQFEMKCDEKELPFLSLCLKKIDGNFVYDMNY